MLEATAELGDQSRNPEPGTRNPQTQTLNPTGVSRSYETASPPQDHRRGLGIGLLKGPRGGAVSDERGTPVTGGVGAGGNRGTGRESLAAPGAFAGMAAVRCDVPLLGQSSREMVLNMWLSLGDNFGLRLEERTLEQGVRSKRRAAIGATA